MLKGAGTKGYTAPEILAGKSYDSSADIWSLGCLIHAMLTVTLPYHTTGSSRKNSYVEGAPPQKSSMQQNPPSGKKYLDLRTLKKSLKQTATSNDDQDFKLSADLLVQMLQIEPTERPNI